MNPIKISDTTFRDGHQSLIATRLRMEDMEPIAAEMGAIGFHSMEVWGGATFDTATRYLAEDPWERLRAFKRLIPDTPLTMLLRGQSLVGYRNYADDVVEAFVRRAAETGIDVFRVFDALNDERNPGDGRSRRQGGRQTPSAGHLLLGHRGGQARRADLQSRLLRGARPDLRRPRSGQPGRQGHGGPARAIRRLRAVPRAEEGGRRAVAAPHALHQRHGLDVVRQGGRRGRRRRGRRAGAAGAPYFPACRRAAGDDVPRHRQGHRARPGQAAEDGRSPRVGAAQVPRTLGERQVGRHRREGAEPPDTGRHGEQPDGAAPRGRGHRPYGRGAGGDPAHEAGAWVPAAGHAAEPDGRHPGRDERPLWPVQADRRRDQGLRVRPLRHAPRADGRGGRVEGARMDTRTARRPSPYVPATCSSRSSTRQPTPSRISPTTWTTCWYTRSIRPRGCGSCASSTVWTRCRTR